ncbi:MAG TPA: exonuclease domain-containing protein [Steroidobacteraceae bacterium]|nr:exonuclease domain-containing protein [Steroidobacteraceae bacterium]
MNNRNERVGLLIRVIDIETTGIDPATDAIIEIASIDKVRDGGIINAMDTLVRPGRPIPSGASAVHHIVDEDVQNAPALTEVIDRFRGADYYVAHNSEFESSFFAAQGVELGPWICTYKCALRVWPELDGHSNQELRYALGRATPFPGFDRSSISPHRAAFDVVVTAAIFEELIKRARWSELVQWSGEPALHTRFHFGKYRGQRYDAIAVSDPNYLRWIVEKSELDEGIKHSAGYWLRNQC